MISTFRAKKHHDTVLPESRFTRKHAKCGCMRGNLGPIAKR